MGESTFNPLSYPIMFSIPRAISGASSWTQHIPFAFLVTQLTRPRVFVELGTFGGDSYLSFCQAVTQLQLPTRCWAVDTWIGDPHSGFYGPEVLQWLRSKHDGVYGAFSKLIQSDFDTASQHFQNGQIDLLHIDGLHTYDAVKHDFEKWLPKLSERGVVLFHDTCVRNRNFGVWRLWEELSPRYPSFEFHHGWGLGILAVGSNQAPAELLNFLHFANGNAQLIRNVFSAIGERMEYFNQLTKLSAVMVEQAAHLRDAHQAMGLRWDLPVDAAAASTDTVGYARSLMQQIGTLTRETTQLRNRARQLELELSHLRANTSGPKSSA